MPHAQAAAVLTHVLVAAALGAWPVTAGELQEECIPQWYREQKEALLASGGSLDDIKCPHGYRLPGDVTWSSNGNLQFHEMVLCVFYSYVPVLVIVVAVLEFLLVRGTRELFFVLFIVGTIALNEGIVKKLVSEPRPSMSCCTSCGMPSSHSAFATGFFVLMFLDAAYRVNPMDVATKSRTRWDMIREHTLILRGRGPLSNPTTLSNRAFVYLCFQWGCLLLPVPLSRIYLKDHSVNQVIVGSLAGVIYGHAFFYGAYEPFARQMKYAESWRWPRGTKYGYLMVNTLRLPWWRHRNTSRTNASGVATDCEDQSDLIYGRSLTRIEVPISSVEVRDGQTYGVITGMQLEVVRGKWTGVAWPSQKGKNGARQAGACGDTDTSVSCEFSEVPDDSEESEASSLSAAGLKAGVV